MNRRLLFDGGAREIGVLPIQSALSGSLSATLSAATLSSTGDITGAGIDGSLIQTLGAATLSSTGDITGAGIDGSLTQTLSAASLSSTGIGPIDGAVSAILEGATLSAQGQGPSPEKTIYQEIWIVEEKKKKAKKKLRKKLGIVRESVKKAQEAQEAARDWKSREQAISLAQDKLAIAQSTLELFNSQVIFRRAIYEQKVLEDAQKSLQLQAERLVKIQQRERELRLMEEKEELMMLMAYMLQLD